MSRVGVTGATGFIGGALVPSLLRRGYELRLVDNRSGPVHVGFSGHAVPNLDFASDDALKALSDSDIVLHMAAVSGVVACARDPEGSARVNIDGTRRLYAMCRERKIPVAFASSFAVVGAPEHLPVREDTPARPTHEYARQKAAGERLTAEFGQDGAVRAAILRQSNVYGGYDSDAGYVTKGNVLELFAHQAGERQLRVNAPGTQRRDFIHIEDVVDHWEATIRWLLRGAGASGAVTFNVASGEAYSVNELALLVQAAYARAHPERPLVRIEVVPNPRGEIELVEPAFAVDRSVTERMLGLPVRHRVADEVPRILAEAESHGR